MRGALTPLLLVVVIWVLAGILGSRVLEYRDQIVTVTSEKGTRHFTAPGLIIPLWMDHQSWTAPKKPGQPQEFANIDIQKGLYAKDNVPTLQATIAGVIFPAILVGISLLWVGTYFRYRRQQTPAK